MSWLEPNQNQETDNIEAYTAWISLRMSQNQLDNNKDSQKPSRNQIGSSDACQTVCSKEQHEQIWAIHGTHNQLRLLVCTT